MSKPVNTYRRYALAGATFSCAVSIGFLMQFSEPGYAGHSPANAVDPGIEPTSNPPQISKSSLPALPKELDKEVSLPSEAVFLVVSRDVPIGLLPNEESAPNLGCEISLVAEPIAGALVNLTVQAPCLAGERLTIRHSDMLFTDILPEDGSLSVDVPALAEQSLFVVAFANGDGAVVRTEVSSLAFYDRIVVQWQGDTGVELHALEFGASYGDAGHVWRESARDVSSAASGDGGFLTRLGNEALKEGKFAEVYTFPSLTSKQQGAVALSVEAEIGEANCDRPITAQAIEVHRGSETRIQDLKVEMPNCDAAGEFLVLKNLLEDLKIARN